MGKDPTVQVYTKLSGEWGPRDCSLRSCTEFYDVIEKGEEESVQFFNDWVAEVKKNVPENRILLFQAKDGWQPLCKFLGVPVPDVPYPKNKWHWKHPWEIWKPTNEISNLLSTCCTPNLGGCGVNATWSSLVASMVDCQKIPIVLLDVEI